MSLYIKTSSGWSKYAAYVKVSGSFVPLLAEVVAPAQTWQEAWNTGSLDTLRSWFAANTGPTINIDLIKPLTGTITITSQAEADALAGRIIEGQILLRGAVVLHDFILKGSGARSLIEVGDSGSALTGWTIRDIEIDGQMKKNSIGIGGQGYAQGTVERVNIHGCGFDGIRIMDRTTYRHLFVHDLWQWDDTIEGRPYNGSNSQNTDPHTDGIQATRGSNIFIEQSFVDLHTASNATGALMCKTDAAAISNFTFQTSYINGGSYIFFVLAGAHGDPTASIINNRVGRNFKQGLWSFNNSTTIRDTIVRTGNVWADTLEPVTLAEGPL